MTTAQKIAQHFTTESGYQISHTAGGTFLPDACAWAGGRFTDANHWEFRDGSAIAVTERGWSVV